MNALPACIAPGHTAVITGAALGIGRAAAARLAGLGMNVCLVDLPGEDLEAALEHVGKAARRADAVIAVPADVADEAQVSALATEAIDRLGTPHLLMNNAVTRIGRGFDADLAEWRRAMDVNLFGVVLGVRAFLPAMQAAGGSRAIVNTGSKQGITNPPGHPIYNMTKAALKTYTEALEHELRSQAGSAAAPRVAAHLLVPGWTTTGHSPHKPGAWLPDQVVDVMLTRMAAGDFYIVCPDGEVTVAMDAARILWAAGDIVENRPPLSRWHPDHRDRFDS